MSLELRDLAAPLRPVAPSRHSIAREISYAASARSRPGQVLIRALENATGRMSLIRRAVGYDAEIEAGRDFWRVMVDRYGIKLDLIAGSLDRIPHTGPLVVVANHPYGVLDGLVLGHILSGVRGGDVRILAHQVFRGAPALNRAILPIDFSGTRAATEANLASRAEAIAHLHAGGAIGIFPGGTVSTAATPFGRPMDPVWRAFCARMIQKSGATVVPIWFDGASSRVFQLASHLNYTLRMALLLREFRRRVDRPVRLAIGAPIAADALASAADGKEMMDFLRRRTYALSPEPLDPGLLGHEFEEQYRQ